MKQKNPSVPIPMFLDFDAQPPKQVVKPKTAKRKDNNGIEQRGLPRRTLRRPQQFGVAPQVPNSEVPKAALDSNNDQRPAPQATKPKVEIKRHQMRSIRGISIHQTPYRERPSSQQLATKPKVETKKEDNTGIGTVQGPLLRHPLRRPSILSAGTPSTSAAASNNNKPTIIQPPMRFGNIYSTRRSVLPPTSPLTIRGKAAGISHGVRGISIHPSDPTS